VIGFAPAWETSGSTPLDTTPVLEGSSFSFQLVAHDTATTVVPVSSTLTVTFGSAPGTISAVFVNGTIISQGLVSLNGNTLQINAVDLGLTGDTAHVLVRRNRALTFARLSGELPPGLTLTAYGVISGTTGDIPPTKTSYDFTVRVSNGTRVRDRAFVIRTVPQSETKTISRASLPINTDTGGEFDYVVFGSYPRAEGFLRTLEITNSDGDEVLEFVPTGYEGDFFEGPPRGIRLVGPAIKGTIAANAPAGRYVFRINIVGQPLSSSILGEIVVQDALAVYVERPLIVEWITAAGSLGDVAEGYPIAFRVEAKNDDGEVSYTLSPGSNSLPTGMRINTRTGEIEGMAPHVEEDTQYDFTLRATRQGNFVDRRFSFRVRNLYTTHEVLDVRLKLRSRDRLPMVNRYREIVPTEILYRRTDPEFGLPADPYIYLIKGVAAAPFAEALKGDGSDAITKNKDYHGRMDLILGRHRHAVVRDSHGRVIHEVVYREVYDPQGRAGGFSFTAEEVTEEQVIHAQSEKVVYAISLRNARLDIVRDCGFPTSNPRLRAQVGLGSSESLPRWMASPQTANDPTTALGYVPALLVANVMIGTGEALAKALNADTDLPPEGRQITLDRYYLYSITYSAPTTFDGDGARFDGPPFTAAQITFDLGIDGSETPIQV
jgi:hypothetical protein